MTRLTTTRDVVWNVIPRYAKGETLDVGAGTAKYGRFIKAHVESYKTSDLFAGPEMDFVEDATKLSFSDNTWDTVMSFQTLEHVEDPDKMLQELFHVLKPNGHCIVTVPFLVAEHKDPTDFQRFTKDGLSKIFKKNGFKVIECQSYGGYFAVQGEMVKFMFFPPRKRKNFGKIMTRIMNEFINLFAILDRWGISKDPNFYANVYIVAQK